MLAEKLSTVARRLLPRNRFARSVSVLAGGTAAGQLIVVGASPILTRLYTPEDFGLLAVYAGLLGTLGVVASLRYQLAIPLPESDEEAASVTVLSLLVVLGMTALCALLVALYGASIVQILNTPALEPFMWLLPLGLLLAGTYQVFQYWAIRTKEFPALARTKLTCAAAMVAVQVGGSTLGPVALVAGQAAGHAAGVNSLRILALRKRWNTFRQVRPGTIAWFANRYRRFPIYSSWEGALNTAGLQLPAVLFAVLFAPSAAGVYLLAHRVLAAPMQVLGTALADVFYSSATEARREDRLGTLVADIHNKLAHIAMPPALILLFAGPDIFAFVFGADWRQAGEFAQWMAPWMYFVFVTSPLSRLFLVLEKQAHGMIFQCVLFGGRIGSLFVGHYMGSLALTVALFTTTSALCWLGFLAWLVRVSGNTWRQAWQPSVTAMASSALLVAPLVLFYSFAEAQVLWFVALIISALLIVTRYAAMIKRFW